MEKMIRFRAKVLQHLEKTGGWDTQRQLWKALNRHVRNKKELDEILNSFGDKLIIRVERGLIGYKRPTTIIRLAGVEVLNEIVVPPVIENPRRVKPLRTKQEMRDAHRAKRLKDQSRYYRLSREFLTLLQLAEKGNVEAENLLIEAAAEENAEAKLALKRLAWHRAIQMHRARFEVMSLEEFKKISSPPKDGPERTAWLCLRRERGIHGDRPRGWNLKRKPKYEIPQNGQLSTPEPAQEPTPEQPQTLAEQSEKFWKWREGDEHDEHPA